MHAAIAGDLPTIPAEGWDQVRRPAFAELIDHAPQPSRHNNHAADLR
jgi:hypothetical protein